MTLPRCDHPVTPERAAQIKATQIKATQIRERYTAERERRVRPDGAAQYQPTDAEFGYFAEDPYTERIEREPVRDVVDVAVVGGGFGGILAGARLRQQGIGSVRIIEKGGDFGGTWYWNRYPGIHCDIDAAVYLPLLEETGYIPRWKYAPGEEIRQHSVRIAEKFGLYEDALFSTAVTSLTWSEPDQRWVVTTDRGDEFRATYVITATGTLTDPKLPGIPGIETFAGHTFHTSRWDYDYTGGTAEGGMTGLAERRVGIVGTGATGIQAIPALAEDAGHLYVFQRTPSTVGVRGQRPLSAADVGADRPGWATERRENFLRLVSGEAVPGVEEDLVDDAWTESAALLEKLLPSFRRDGVDSREQSEAAYEALDHTTMERIRSRVSEIVEDPATAAALQPWYRYACKRPTFSDKYLPAFNRDNVTLIDTADSHGIERMTERGVVVDGVEYEIDALVFATGFSVGVSGITSGKLPVTGRGGVQLTQAWAQEGPRSLHGFASNGFPNLIKMGSQHNASSVNFSHILDEQAVHAAALVAAAEARGALIEPSRDSEDAWAQRLAKGAPKHAWFHAECTPGYYNAEGKGRPDSSSSYPGSAVAFHEELRTWREGSIDEGLRVRGDRSPR